MLLGTVGGIALAALLLAGLFWADLTFARAVPGGQDLLLAWRGMRGFVFDKINPYEVQVAQSVAGLSGGPELRLQLPFPILLLYFFFTLIPDPETVRAAGMIFAQVAGFLLAGLALLLTGWKTGRVTRALYILSALLWAPAVLGWAQGSPAALLVVLLAGALLASANGSEELAGALLALTVARPSLSAPVLIFLLIRADRARRWRMLAGFGMTLLVLIVVASMIFPSWALEFGRAFLVNTRAVESWTLRSALEAWLPDYGADIAIALVISFAALLAVEWSGARRGDARRLLWTACLTLAVTPLLGMTVTPAHLALLWLPLTLILKVLLERWRRAAWLGIALLLLVLGGPWLWLARGPFEPGLIFLLPAATVLGLYWMRWWALRPPRTWLDRVSAGQV